MEKRLIAMIEEAKMHRQKISEKIPLSESLESSTEKTKSVIASGPQLPALVNAASNAEFSGGAAIDGEQLKALYDMIHQLQEDFNNRLKENEKHRTKLEKELKKLKHSLREKADREAVIDGQQ